MHIGTAEPQNNRGARGAWINVCSGGRWGGYYGDPDGPTPPESEIYWPVDDEPEMEGVEPEPDPSTSHKSRERFCGRWPDESEALPELEYWDADQTLPKGGIGLLYGTKGSHKTGIALTKAFEAMQAGDACVCYAVGEGAQGLERQRVPAQCRKRGINP